MHQLSLSFLLFSLSLKKEKRKGKEKRLMHELVPYEIKTETREIRFITTMNGF
jgi:hypothetical protein